MRMILTQHFSYNTGAFLIWFVVRVTQFPHSIENAAMHRFKSVAHIRQSTGYDYGH